MRGEEKRKGKIEYCYGEISGDELASVHGDVDDAGDIVGNSPIYNARLLSPNSPTDHERYGLMWTPRVESIKYSLATFGKVPHGTALVWSSSKL